MSAGPANLVLIGLRATGKTTLGKALATRLGWTFHDTDAEIEARAGRPIADYFKQGEQAFRDMETAVLCDLAEASGCVISTGGGIILRSENRRRLAALGPCVWLDAPAAVLRARMASQPDTRPTLTGTDPLDEIEQIRIARAPLYAALAEMQIDTAKASCGQLVDEVLGYFGMAEA